MTAGRSRIVIAALLALTATAAAAQDWGAETPCAGMLEDGTVLPPMLASVPRYGATYVLVFPERIAEQIDVGLDSTVLRTVVVGAHAGTPAETLARDTLGDGVTAVPYDEADPGALVQKILDGEVDAAVLWSPLAGLGALELDFDYALSMTTVGLPSPPPGPFAHTGTAEAAEEGSCSAEVAAALGGYGVVPAEKLVPVDIRDLLHLAAPASDLAAARVGLDPYEANCAKCHGAEAVAATDSLAPVDLLVSVRRFTYPGFLYIVLNGRSKNGMPGFKGTLSQDEITQIYHYVRERARGALDAQPATSVEAPAPAVEGSP